MTDDWFNLPFPAALLLAMVAAALMGVTVEYVAYRPLRRSPSWP